MTDKLLLCDPVGVVSPSTRHRAALNWAPGGRIATLFNNHVSSYRVWKRLEELIGEHCAAKRLSSFVKENTFAEAPRETLQQLVGEADVAVVGVGA